MGGRSPEHEVSLMSGAEVLKHLDSKKYEIVPITIPRNGTRIPDRVGDDRKNTIVFIAMHGIYGEDGTIQGMLEAMGLRYTGSGILASALGMDKLHFRKLMIAEGITIPQYMAVDKETKISEIEKKLKYLLFVKPNAQGSSVGAGIAKNRLELVKRIKEAQKYGTTVLVDEYISGREFTCAVLGNEDCCALPVVEIKPLKGDFFDYASKYTESGSEEICPAKISLGLTKQIQTLAVKVYKAVGCRGFGRVDFLLKDGKVPVVLEINTIPGLTPASLFPKSAKAVGISYSELLDKLIKYAHDRN